MTTPSNRRKRISAIEQIDVMAERGWSVATIAERTGRNVKYVEHRVNLWRQGQMQRPDNPPIEAGRDAQFVLAVLREAHRLGLAA